MQTSGGFYSPSTVAFCCFGSRGVTSDTPWEDKKEETANKMRGGERNRVGKGRHQRNVDHLCTVISTAQGSVQSGGEG